MLAVANNPQLKVKRDNLGVAHAQAFSAGLLPDPQLGAEVDFPTSTGGSLTRAFNLGLSEDISALLTRPARTAAAHAHVRQINLKLLWAEWQTIARARMLFDQVQSSKAQVQLLAHETSMLAPLEQQIKKALKAGNLTYAGVTSGLNALTNMHQLLEQARHQHTQAEHDLHQLLGLAPGVPLHLVGTTWQVVPDAQQVRNAMLALPRRRPDLQALKAGYEAQDARLRGAILAQFPAITLGFVRTRDTSNVYTSGFTVGITLPIFNRNRGHIAVARATRQKLHDAYDARLLTTRQDMHRLQQDLALLHEQIGAASQRAEQLDSARRSAVNAWRAGALDWPTYLAIRSHALSANLLLLTLHQQRDHQAIALQTLLGGDWNTGNKANVMSDSPAPPPSNPSA